MTGRPRIALPASQPFLDRVFSVAPLVVVGTLEEDGTPDLAPKHMVTPLGDQHLCFVCSPTHATHRNLVRDGSFSVSWLRHDAVLVASLASAPRAADGTKPSVAALPTRSTVVIDGVALQDTPLVAECRVDRVIDDWGHWSLVVGEVVHADADPDALITTDEDPHDVLARSPLLAYVHPDHLAQVDRAQAFPFHTGFQQ